MGLRIGEAELREEPPDAAPAAGENASPDYLGSAEAEEDEDEDVVGERAEAVLSGEGGLRALGGGLLAARLHGNGAGQGAAAAVGVRDCVRVISGCVGRK